MQSPPEPFREVSVHLLAAGRELAEALGLVAGVARRALAERLAGQPPEPHTIALEEGLRWLEQAGSWMALLGGGLGARPGATGRRETLETLQRIFDEAGRAAGEGGDTEAGEARASLLRELRQAVERELGAA